MKKIDETAVENLRTYLRIPSVHPNIDYEPCLDFLRKQAEEIGLNFSVYRPVKDKPHAVLTWTGKEPSLESIILNSHMDVVPVFEDKWSHKPFAADLDEKGDIYARGAQDTKSLGVQYLEAIKRLKLSGFQPKRTVHVTFASEEELGGNEGMRVFVKTPEFKALNAGFALDESVGSENDVAPIFYGEKRSWKFEAHCIGQPGHGSLLLEDTAGEKIQSLLKKLYDFRADEKKLQTKLQQADDVISINLTMMKGGVQANVIPSEFTLTFDTRVPIERFAAFEAQVNAWCKEAGSRVTIKDLVKDDGVPHTRLDDSNRYWLAFKAAMDGMGIQLDAHVYSANTDGRFMRGVGIPTIGYSNAFNTKIRPHDNDEYLNVDEFLRGIQRFEKIIPAIANV